ncbi:large conductance mechanosensitive channel [Entomortierella parvispora]|uniref:Large conductance mechanosensitive channel n=1 Tax=Entomortierella parvispora TaxID=205924 RepID=A0A9P3LT76_9FUNG|nr:large conductance mechanosensitive channel [Entomortierella parvispora]
MPGIRERVKESGAWTNFVKFIQRGNIIDLGVGLVIGGAFSKVLSSFVDDILTPPLGLVVAGSNMENYFIVLRRGKTPGQQYETIEDAQKDGAVTENVGRFIMTIINFLLVAVTLFVIVYTAQKVSEARERHRLKHHSNGDAAPEVTKPEPVPASGATATCPWCSANVPIKAVKCMYCTSFLHEKVPAELLNKTPQTALIELDG